MIILFLLLLLALAFGPVGIAVGLWVFGIRMSA
jgi:hypothetical protein